MSTPRKSDKTISVTIKLQYVVFAIVLLIIGIQTWFNISNAREQNEVETKQTLLALYNEFNEKVKILEKTAAALSHSFAQRPDIQEHFQATDRQGILALLEPVFTTLKTDYDIVHLQFHEPNGFIFLRIHAPEQYGDYTFTYRRANALAIISRQTVAGVEIDPNRLGIQGVSPVFHQGQFVGLVEVGLDYDRAFIEDLKARNGANYKMWVTHKDAAPAGLGPVDGAPESPSPELFYYAGTNPTPLPLPAEVYHMVLQNGEPQTHFISVGNQELAVLVAPMLGYGDRIIGVLEISISRAEALAALQRSQRTTLTVAGGLALLALALMWASTSLVVLRPLRHLTAVAFRQLQGDLTARVKLLPRDEFGQLGHTLNVLTETLDNTLKDQEITIAERTARYRSLFEDSPISLWEEDLTEVKRHIDGLRDSGVSNFRAYFEEHPEAVTRCAERVKILDVNQATLELFKARRKEEISEGLGTVFSEESSAVFQEKMIAFAEGKTRFESEATLQTLPGDKIHTVLSLAVAPGYEETGSKVFVSIIDITERKRAEEALRESEERFRQVITSISDHIYMSEVTEDGSYVNHYLSPNVEALTGYPLERFMPDWSFWPSSVIQSDDRAPAAAQAKRLAMGQDSEIEYRLVRADGQVIWVRDNARVERRNGSKFIYGVVSNITERKQLEEQLRQSQKLEAIGRLAGGVAHDFNNLLTVIIGNCDFILDDLGPSDPWRKDVSQIREAGERAAMLTGQLLAFSRQQVLQPRLLDLNTVVANIERMLQRLIGEDIDLVTILEPQLGQVKADPGQIEQVIMNLAVNARDVMPHGGKLTVETANVSLDQAYAQQHTGVKPGPYTMLALSDTGSGMDTETRARIFEPFFTTKEQGKGTGLGLATVHGIINQSGGHIWVYSEPDQGTTFKIYLPRIEETAEMVSHTQAPAKAGRGSETILLVEDEDIVRKLAHRLLSKDGYTVLEASYGEEALQVSARYQGQIHLLLTDVIMPRGMSGRQLAEQLTSLRPEMKILYISGYTDNVIVHHGMLDSGLAFLQKPFTPDALTRKVREVLDG